jgi:processive 1,2-diacylglycerol beta-glucosyltransferase
MIELREKGSETRIGEVSDEQLQFLIDQLEEEDLEDRDYAITPMLLQMFEAEGAEEPLISLLREALGDRPTMEIVWTRET